MAKVYVTRTENINDIWVYDVKSIDTEMVVFNDGSTRLCHRDYADTHFWRTEEEARGAIAFAKRFAKNQFNQMRDQIYFLECPIDGSIEVLKKN